MSKKKGGMTADERRNQSNHYYKTLMERFKTVKLDVDKKQTYGMGRISEEIQILGTDKSLAEKVLYNKYYWNLIAITSIFKEFPEHKSGNFAYGLSKADVQKHYQKGRQVYSQSIQKMEQIYARNHSNKFKQGSSKKGRLMSFKDFMKGGGEKEEESNVNQFQNFLVSNYTYRDVVSTHKKSKMIKEDKKWLKLLRGGGMDELFKQRICEQHFHKVFAQEDYPIKKCLAALIGHIKQTFEDMEKGIFCNIEKLCQDFSGLKDLFATEVIEGYKLLVKGVEKHNFPLSIMHKSVWEYILTNCGRNIIPLFRKFNTQKLEQKINKLREYLLLERLPIDKKLHLKEEKVPYEKAIKKFSEITKTMIVGDQIKIFEESYELIFKCIDEYYEKHDKNMVGMKITDGDLSQIILYIMLNADVYGVASWIQYIREFKNIRQNFPIFNLFDQILEWVKDIEVHTPDDDKNDDDEEDFAPVNLPPKPKRQKPHVKQVSKIDLFKLVEEEGGVVERTSPRARRPPKGGRGMKKKRSYSNINNFNSDMDDHMDADEKDEKLLELEKAINEKNLLIELLEKKVFQKLQDVRKAIKLPQMDKSQFS